MYVKYIRLHLLRPLNFGVRTVPYWLLYNSDIFFIHQYNAGFVPNTKFLPFYKCQSSSFYYITCCANVPHHFTA